ncbi:MAG: YhcH/YjgK/YiaL family protein [Cetobacterium sp.]
MIYDTISNIKRYKGLNENLDIVIDKIINNEIEVKLGRYEIKAEEIFYNVSSYITEEVAVKDFETHEVYIDLQIVLSGEEFIGYTNIDKLDVVEGYNKKEDYEKQDGIVDTFFKMENGYFLIIFPEEAHMPGLDFTTSETIKKIVFKIKK